MVMLLKHIFSICFQLWLTTKLCRSSNFRWLRNTSPATSSVNIILSELRQESLNSMQKCKMLFMRYLSRVLLIIVAPSDPSPRFSTSILYHRKPSPWANTVGFGHLTHSNDVFVYLYSQRPSPSRIFLSKQWSPRTLIDSLLLVSIVGPPAHLIDSLHSISRHNDFPTVQPSPSSNLGSSKCVAVF